MRLPRIPQYEAKGYVEGFETKAQELFSRCFGGRVFKQSCWDWQFNNNPVENRRITTLWDNDTLIALTALTPSYATLDGNKVLCAVSGTTMARDDYRGVSIQLVSECANQSKDIVFKYSFPNSQAFRIATQFYGHHYVGDIAFWTITPREFSKNESISRIDSFLNEHGELYKGLIYDHKFIKNRDTNYLNWRFVEKPDCGYEIYQYFDEQVLGYIVLNEYIEGNEKHLQIIDVVGLNNLVFCDLIKYAINIGYNRKVDVIKLWMTSKNYTNILSDIGFEYGRQPFRMTVWDRNIDLTDVYITMSDSDVF